MNKEIKKRIFVSIGSIMIGLIVLACTFAFKSSFTEEKISYATGFSSGLMFIGVLVLIRTIFAISRADKGKKIVDTLQDERLISINNQAGEITFRIMTGLEAIACMVLFFMEKEREASVLATVIGVSTLLYLVTYIILSKRK